MGCNISFGFDQPFSCEFGNIDQNSPLSIPASVFLSNGTVGQPARVIAAQFEKGEYFSLCGMCISLNLNLPHAVLIQKGIATGGSNSTLDDSAHNWPVNFWTGGAQTLLVLTGAGAGTLIAVDSNTSTTLSFGAQAFAISAGDQYALVVESGNLSGLSADAVDCTGIVPEDGEYEIHLFSESPTLPYGRYFLGLQRSTNTRAICFLEDNLIGTALDTFRNRLVVTEYDSSGNNFIRRINPSTGETDLRVASAVPHQTVNGLVYVPVTDRLLWMGRNNNLVYELHPNTFAVTRTLDLTPDITGFNQPTFPIFADTLGGIVMAAAGFGNNRLRFIEPVGLTLLGGTDLAGKRVLFCPVDGNAWAYTDGGATINVVNPSTFAIDQTVAVNTAAGGAFNPDNGLVYFGRTSAPTNSITNVDPLTYNEGVPVICSDEHVQIIAHQPVDGLMWFLSSRIEFEMLLARGFDPATLNVAASSQGVLDINNGSFLMWPVPDGGILVPDYGYIENRGGAINVIARITP